MKISEDEFKLFKNSSFKFLKALEDIPAQRVIIWDNENNAKLIRADNALVSRGGVSHWDVKAGDIGLFRTQDHY